LDERRGRGRLAEEQARHSGAAGLHLLKRNAAMSDTSDAILLCRLEEAASNLPRLQREILMAHRLDNMPYYEIARRTGLTVHQVERHMGKAIYKLAKQLDGRKLSWWERRF